MNRRRMPLVLALTAVLVFTVLGWIVPLSKNSQAAPAPSSDAAFKGKVLCVSMDNTMIVFPLEKVQLQKIGDHSFLVGKGVTSDESDGWFNGRTVRLQMEHIVSIIEFDNLKDAKKAFESAPLGGGGMFFAPSPARSGGYAPPGAGLPFPEVKPVPKEKK